MAKKNNTDPYNFKETAEGLEERREAIEKGKAQIGKSYQKSSRKQKKEN